MNPRCHALVPAAGSGTRAGATQPKQYVRIAGLPVIAHTLHALLAVPRIGQVLVAVARDDAGFEAQVGALLASRVQVSRCGGASRAATVSAGLIALRAQGAHDDDWVLVHDAARCLLRPEWVEALIDACQGDRVGGLLAVPAADTLKRQVKGDGQGRVAETIPREGIWQAQTPQMFRLGPLAAALESAGDAVTDESSAMERAGHAPRLVHGSPENWKVTHAADFALAETLLQRRRG